MGVFGNTNSYKLIEHILNILRIHSKFCPGSSFECDLLLMMIEISQSLICKIILSQMLYVI